MAFEDPIGLLITERLTDFDPIVPKGSFRTDIQSIRAKRLYWGESYYKHHPRFIMPLPSGGIGIRRSVKNLDEKMGVVSVFHERERRHSLIEDTFLYSKRPA